MRTITSCVSSVTKNRLVYDFGITLGSNIALTISGALTGILAARLLGPEQRGMLAAVFAWVAILGAVSQMGITQALTFHVAQKLDSASQLLTSALVIILSQSICIFVMGYILVKILLPGNCSLGDLILVYLLSIPLASVTSYVFSVALGLGRYLEFNFLRILLTNVPFLGVLTSSLLQVNNVSTLIMLILLFYIISAICSIVIAQSRFHLSAPSNIHYRRLISYGLRSWLGDLSSVANARIDQFVLALYVPNLQLGYYAVAMSYSNLLSPISQAFSIVLFPHIATNPDHANNDIRLVSLANMGMSLVGFFLLAILDGYCIPALFGPGYEPALQLTRVLLVANMLSGFSSVLGHGLRGMGKPGIVSVAQILGLFTVIAGMTVFVPRSGIVGGTWAVLLGYGVSALCLIATIGFWKRISYEKP